MPKQSRVNKPSGFQGEVRQRLATLEIQYDQINGNLKNAFERLCKLETAAVDVEEDTDRIDTRVDVLGDTLKSQIKTLEGALTIYLNTEIKQLNARMGSDFQDQDDEIEKISRRLQSVEDKLKVKQLGEETNVTLTARVKELQRQLTDAKNRIEQMETQSLQTSHLIAIERDEWQRSVENVRKERDAEMGRADRVQRELNEAGIAITELQFKLAAAERKPKPLFWGRFGELRKKT